MAPKRKKSEAIDSPDPQKTTVRRSRRSFGQVINYSEANGSSGDDEINGDDEAVKSIYFKNVKKSKTPAPKVMSKYFSETTDHSPKNKRLKTFAKSRKSNDNAKHDLIQTVVLENDDFYDAEDPEYKPDKEEEKKLKAKVSTKCSKPKVQSKKEKSTKKVRKPAETLTKPEGEVTDLLMQMEFSQNPIGFQTGNSKDTQNSNQTDDSDNFDSEDDFEEVEDAELSADEFEIKSHKANVGKEGIDIRVGEAFQPRQVKKVSTVNWELDAARMNLNRQMKQVQANLHCIQVLCLVARQRYLMNLAADPLIQAMIISTELDQLTSLGPELSVRAIRSFLVNFTKCCKIEHTPVAKAFTMDAISKFLQKKDTDVADVYSFTCFALAYIHLQRLDKLSHLRLCYAMEPVSKRPDSVFVFKKEDKKRVTQTVITKKLNNQRPFKRTIKEPDLFPIRFWTEILIDQPEERWVSVEPLNQYLDANDQIEACFQYPINYVLALNVKLNLSEVTQQYCQKYFEPRYRKTRDDGFLAELLLQNGGSIDALQTNKTDISTQINNNCEQANTEEDTSVPLPKTLASFKDHPVYVLPRHLLKYEVLHPADVEPVGEFRNEPVFLRKYVHIAHSRDYWKRQARSVFEHEKPCKVVTARPKWDKNLQDYIRGLPLEIYGEWQTGPYVPPEAKDGKVPRNEFHNVDLFRPEMLPKGCVHLRLSGLLRIASKLNIDCAAAVTGFDVKNRGTVPVLDGFVVCCEYEQILRDAWQQEQENIKKREQERYYARVFKNWKKLINLAKARIRIKSRYENMEDDAIV